MLPIIRKKGGFTLIELLVVIAILSVLLVIVLVAINPARQTREARNTERRADVLTILNAVNQYFIANGSFPSGTPATTGTAVPIKSGTGPTVTGDAFCTDLVDDGNYVAALPFDPIKHTPPYQYTSCSNYNTGYEITKNNGDRITISAPEVVNDGGGTIQATR